MWVIFDYNQTQKEVATKLREQGILSQEGFDQFEARNFRAFPSDEENITAKALDILDEGTFDAEAKDIIQTGQKGVTADKQGFLPPKWVRLVLIKQHSYYLILRTMLKT